VGRRSCAYQRNLLFLFSFLLSSFYLLLDGAPKKLELPELKSVAYIFVYASLGRLGTRHTVPLEHSTTVEPRPSDHQP